MYNNPCIFTKFVKYPQPGHLLHDISYRKRYPFNSFKWLWLSWNFLLSVSVFLSLSLSLSISSYYWSRIYSLLEFVAAWLILNLQFLHLLSLTSRSCSVAFDSSFSLADITTVFVSFSSSFSFVFFLFVSSEKKVCLSL